MSLSRIVGILIFAALFIWVMADVFTPVNDIAFLGISAGAEDTLLVPKSEFDDAFEQTSALAMDAKNSAGFFGFLENLCKWLAVAASALITLIGGYKGKPTTNKDELNNVDADQLPARFSRMVTFLGATSAVCVMASAPFQSEKIAAYDKDSCYRTPTQINKLESPKNFLGHT